MSNQEGLSFPVVGDGVTGAKFMDKIQQVLLDMSSSNSGVVAPADPKVGRLWLDDSVADRWVLKICVVAGASPVWLDLFVLNSPLTVARGVELPATVDLSVLGIVDYLSIVLQGVELDVADSSGVADDTSYSWSKKYSFKGINFYLVDRKYFVANVLQGTYREFYVGTTATDIGTPVRYAGREKLREE